MENQNTSTVLEGIISIKACIDAKSRVVQAVYIDKSKIIKRDRKATYFISFLKQNSIPFELKTREFIDQLVKSSSINRHDKEEAFTPSGTSHGGFVAIAGERRYQELENFLESLKQDGGYAVFLDGVEDPFNFGYSVRNLFAFGAYGFILPKRNWMSASNVVARSSAGASELCKIAVSLDDSKTVELIKRHGIDIVCAALSSDSISLYDFKPTNPFVLFIGGEKRGISAEFIESAGVIVHIPYSNENAKYSLPTASAAAIFGSHLANK